MDPSQLFVALVLLVLVALLVWGRFSVASVFAATAFVFLAAGLIEVEVVSRQLINPGLVTVVLLMLVASVLGKVRLLEAWAYRILQGSYRWMLLKLVVLVGAQSTLLNNTAVVASLIGPVRSVCKQAAPRLLLPMAYAATLGGMMTLIGTSTNLLVSGFVVEAGLPALSILAPLPLGLVLFGACAAVMLLIYPRLLKPSEVEETPREAYLIEAVVTPDSPLVGRSVDANGLNKLDALRLVEIVRTDLLIAPVRPVQTVRAGDRLVFAGAVDRLDLLADYPGLEIDGHPRGIPTDNLLEVIVSGESVLVNRRLRDIDRGAKIDVSHPVRCRPGGGAIGTPAIR